MHREWERRRGRGGRIAALDLEAVSGTVGRGKEWIVGGGGRGRGLSIQTPGAAAIGGAAAEGMATGPEGADAVVGGQVGEGAAPEGAATVGGVGPGTGEPAWVHAQWKIEHLLGVAGAVR